MVNSQTNPADEDRQRTELALEKSELRFRNLIEGSIQGILIHRDQRPLFVNESWAAIHGYTVDEVMQLESVVPLMALTERERIVSYMKLRMCGEPAPTRYEYEGLRKDGSSVWLENMAKVVEWDGGPAVLATIFDLTERRRAEEAVRHSEQRFRKLIESSVQGILIHRANKPLYVNEHWAASLGYSVDEVLARDSVIGFIAPPDRDRMIGYREARLRGEKAPIRYEYQAICKDGSLTWLENTVTVVDWDGELAIQSATIDCTERKLAEEKQRTFHETLERSVEQRTHELAEANKKLHAEIAERQRIEEELRKSEGLYHSLVDNIPLCVARKDLNGRFIFVNRALREMFGKPLDEIIGKTDFDFALPELAEKYQRDDKRVAETGELVDFVETITIEPHGERQIHTLKTAIEDVEGNVVGTQLVFWDITEQTQAEEARRLAQEEISLKNRDLATLLYVTSHDLTEPLRAIQGFSKIVYDRYADVLDDKGRDFLHRVVQAGQRMSQLLDDVLMLSRAQRMVEPTDNVDTGEIVADVLRQLEPAIERTQANVVVADDLPRIRADRMWATRAIYNLVANALKFTQEGQAPAVEIEPYRSEEAGQAGQAGVGLVVLDRGPGIQADHVERIFQLFQRTVGREIPGTGAGLAIVRQVAERHGGWVDVKSRPDGGSAFIISFGEK